MSIKKFFSCLLAMLQMLAITFGIIDIGPADIDYGGEPYVQPQIDKYLTLIENGASEYVIIIGENAPPAERKAATELQSYLEQMSGVLLPIREDTSRLIDTEIIVGKTRRETKSTFTVDREALGSDGFTMFVFGKKPVIAGGGERGTLYGVYTFLEEQLGCRWFTDSLTVVPELDTVKINAELNDTQKPYFELRSTDWKGSYEFLYKHKYNCSARSDLGGGFSYATGCHSMPQLVPDSLFETYSELFAFRKDINARTVQHACLSNPKTLEIAVESAREILRNAPNATHFYVGQKDNQEYCQCERCEKLYEQYKSTSAAMVLFVNGLATALKGEFPSIKFTFLAYQDTRHPPEGIVCVDNAFPTVCTIEACYVHAFTQCGHEDGNDNENFEYKYSDHEPAIANDLKGWAQISPQIYTWNYTVNFLNSMQFFPNFHTLAEDSQYLYDIGCTGMFQEGVTYVTGEFSELRTYIILKLLWNPYADVEYHMMDFMRAFYGKESAEYIKEYIDVATHKIANTNHAFCFDWHYQIGYFNMREIIRFDSLWDKAEAAAENDTQLTNVRRSRLQLRYYKANLMLEEFAPVSPVRAKENEKLYDDIVAHGIPRVTAFTGLPEKSTIDFFLTRPIDWR